MLNVPPILYTPSCDHFKGYSTTLPVTLLVIDEWVFWNVGRVTLTGETEVLGGKNASRCCFVHHKSHMDWRVLLGPSLWMMILTVQNNKLRLLRDYAQRLGTAVPSSGTRVKFAYCITLACWCYKNALVEFMVKTNYVKSHWEWAKSNAAKHMGVFGHAFL